jgi:hypothetical protein
VFAVVSIARTRGGARRGRGLAIAALILSLLWIAGVAAVVAAVISSVAGRDDAGVIDKAGNLSVDALRPGDCLENFGEGGSFTVDAVPCGEPHAAQVYAVYDLPDQDEFPGVETVVSQAEQGCIQRLAAAASGRVDSGELSVAYFHPQEGTWGRGDREVACLVTAENGTMTQPVPTST